jgi:hypothetical protein
MIVRDGGAVLDRILKDRDAAVRPSSRRLAHGALVGETPVE